MSVPELIRPRCQQVSGLSAMVGHVRHLFIPVLRLEERTHSILNEIFRQRDKENSILREVLPARKERRSYGLP
jgi:hypothetical protein